MTTHPQDGLEKDLAVLQTIVDSSDADLGITALS